MPKRVLDFDALWASDKLAACAEWAQPEYAWLYGLADASGSFEMTNLRVIWGRVAAIRPNFTIERLTAVFDEFVAHGLLFTWVQGGKRYGNWTGSNVPGRLPPPSWRARLERLAPDVPQAEFAQYLSRFRPPFAAAEMRCDSTAGRVLPSAAPVGSDARVDSGDPECSELKAMVEEPQAQEWDLKSEKEREGTTTCAGLTSPAHPLEADKGSEDSADQLARIFDEDRGPLPPACVTPESRRRCAMRVAAGLTAATFQLAVRRAAATPFLSGSGARGWCVTFDWLVANDTNVHKVLGGRYEPSGAGHAAPETRVGAAPVAAAFGARVNAATLERIRAREGIASGGHSQFQDLRALQQPGDVGGPSGAERKAALRKGAA